MINTFTIGSISSDANNPIATGDIEAQSKPKPKGTSGTKVGSLSSEAKPASEAAQDLFNQHDNAGSGGQNTYEVTPGTPPATILPNFQISSDPTISLPTSSDELSISSKKFGPYESLSGISKERPEIIMMTNFQPLYKPESATDSASSAAYKENSRDSTKAGFYFDDQCFVRTLRDENIKTLLNKIAIAYPFFSNIIERKTSEFNQTMGQLGISAHYLWNLMRILERIKQQFDIRDDMHVVDPLEILKRHSSTYSSTQGQSTLKYQTETINSAFPERYDIAYVLSRFGFSEENTKSVYTSTKIWLQMLYELKQVLRTHSLEFLEIDTSKQRIDTSPVRLTKTPEIKRFEYAAIYPGDLPFLSQLKDIVPSQVSVVSNIISDTYNSIYENVHFKSEEIRIAALVNLVSKEYRYSRGLSNTGVQETLSTQYQFGVSVGGSNNQQVFDAIVGKFGNSIIDVPATNTNSLAGIAQQQPGDDVVILPFESRYIENDENTFTPGSAYYVDHTLVTDGNNFNTSRLTVLQETIRKAYKNFNTIVDGLNLLSAEYVSDSQLISENYETIISNPRQFFNDLRSTFMSEDEVHEVVKEDIFLPILSAAYNNTRLRSLLLLYYVTKISRKYIVNIPSYNSSSNQDNTAATSKIIEDIVDELLVSAKQSMTSIKPKENTSKKQSDNFDNSIKIESIKAALNSEDSRLYLIIKQKLSRIVAAFRIDSNAISSGKTLYGGHPDTMILMTIFDIIVSMVYNYGNRSITGRHTVAGSTSLVIDKRDQIHSYSVREIDGRLAKETVNSQLAIFAVLNTFYKLTKSIDNVVNYIDSEQSLLQLREITNLIGDPILLPMLFSEQQINLFAATIADMSLTLKAGEQAQGAVPNLDDSIITVKTKNAIDAVMKLPEFSSKAALSNKILTIGVPLGFSRNLQQKVSLSSLKKDSFDTRQKDVVELSVYKVDLLNPSIIYFPQKFLFELSRFPVRHDSLVRDFESKTLRGIVSNFPTRDYQQIFSEGGSSVQYSNSASTESVAFTGESYSFLKNSQKISLYNNHIMSYFLETYVKVMTGITTADYNFNLVEQPPAIDKKFTEIVVNHQVNTIVAVQQLGQPEVVNLGQQNYNPNKKKSSSGKLFTSIDFLGDGYDGTAGSKLVEDNGNSGSGSGSGFQKSVAVSSYTAEPTTSPPPPIKTEEAIDQISPANEKVALHTFGVISELNNSVTPLSNPQLTAKRLISPKQFDRVFNVIINPFNFQIDVKATSSTPHGQQALELMLKKGDIVDTTSQTSTNSVINNESYSSRPRSSSDGDISFEKYIVSFSTFGEIEV